MSPGIKNTWGKWTKKVLPKKNKQEILDLYKRKGDLYVEAPKLNVEIVPMLTGMRKQDAKDLHFVETQNCGHCTSSTERSSINDH